jgi:hypothetical protein
MSFILFINKKYKIVFFNFVNQLEAQQFKEKIKQIIKNVHKFKRNLARQPTALCI